MVGARVRGQGGAERLRARVECGAMGEGETEGEAQRQAHRRRAGHDASQHSGAAGREADAERSDKEACDH